MLQTICQLSIQLGDTKLTVLANSRLFPVTRQFLFLTFYWSCEFEAKYPVI